MGRLPATLLGALVGGVDAAGSVWLGHWAGRGGDLGRAGDDVGVAGLGLGDDDPAVVGVGLGDGVDAGADAAHDRGEGFGDVVCLGRGLDIIDQQGRRDNGGRLPLCKCC